MTPADRPTALGVCRLAARLPAPEQVPAAARVLAVLGMVPYAGRLDPIPTACGHPSAELSRRGTYAGTPCRACQRERRAGR